MKFVTFLIFSILFLSKGISQENIQVRKNLNYLCSEKLKGRGYAKNGVRKAEKYLTKELNKIEGIEVNKHSFNLNANVFDGKLFCKINDTKLRVGEDFILKASSPSINGSYTLKKINFKQLSINQIKEQIKNSTNKILLVDDKEINEHKNKKEIKELLNYLHWKGKSICKGILLYNVKKLTFSSSQWQAQIPYVISNKNFENSSTIKLKIKAKVIKDYSTNNIYVTINGKQKDSSYVFTAHYDHIGLLGKKTHFPGANDNASGTVFLLDLVRYYAKNKPKNSITFIFFSGEEIGLLGSKAFVKDNEIDFSKIKFLFNFDIFGTGVDGVQIVNSTEYKKEYELLNKINTDKNLLKAIKKRGYSCNSDHCAFHDVGVKTFFFYTLGGIRAYHDIYDKAETLPLNKFNELKTLVTDFIDAY